MKQHQKLNLKGESKMIQKIKNFFKDEEGATAVEYGLMVALIAAVIVGAVTILGGNTEATFRGVAGSIQPPAP
jgi:pilus assembly protein Flp/PilA